MMMCVLTLPQRNVPRSSSKTTSHVTVLPKRWVWCRYIFFNNNSNNNNNNNSKRIQSSRQQHDNINLENTCVILSADLLGTCIAGDIACTCTNKYKNLAQYSSYDFKKPIPMSYKLLQSNLSV